MSRKHVIPLFSLTLLIFSFIALFYLGLGSTISGFNNRNVLLDFTSIKCVDPVSITYARWQISILVTNHGKTPLLISDVFVNDKQVNLYGLIHGDSLEDGSQLGTSVPLEGLSLQAGTSENIFVWVGEKLYSNGSEVLIHFNDPNSVSMMKSITLIRYSLGDMKQINKRAHINY